MFGLILGCTVGTLVVAWGIDKIIEKCSGSDSKEHTVKDLYDLADKI